MKKISADELKLLNGEDGQPACIAYDGKVYDVSSSTKWKNGEHMQLHHAGEDLSGILANAPHNDEVFDDFPIVGVYKEELGDEFYFQKHLDFIIDLHIHSISAHFVFTAFTLSPIFLIIYLLIPEINFFDGIGFYLLLIGVIALPVCLLTGLLDWWYKYSMDMTGLFKKKIVFSVLLSLAVVVCVYLYVAFSSFVGEYVNVYLGANMVMLVSTVILGLVGGKIVFPIVSGKKLSRKDSNKEMVEILSMAIPREQQAYKFYKQLAGHARSQQKKSVLDFLAHEEKMHEVKLKKMIRDFKRED